MVQHHGIEAETQVYTNTYIMMENSVILSINTVSSNNLDNDWNQWNTWSRYI